MHLIPETIDMSCGSFTVLLSSFVYDVPNSDDETDEEDSEQYYKYNDCELQTVNLCNRNNVFHR